MCPPANPTVCTPTQEWIAEDPVARKGSGFISEDLFQEELIHALLSPPPSKVAQVK